MRSHQAFLPNQPNIKVCAVVVTYNPDEALLERLAAIKRQAEKVILVDNASGEESRAILQLASEDHHIDVVANTDNVGVAAALNQGIQKARDEGFEWVLTLDQDSEPSQGMLEELWAAYGTVANPERIAIIAPQVIDAEIGRRAPFLRKRFGPFYRRDRCDNSALEDVTAVITSGALVRLSVIEAIGGFREDFFIDYVDTEFCLRALSHGYRIAVACRAELKHRLGDRRKLRLGLFSLYPTFHSPVRWYSISRNRIPMLRAYSLRFPHWLAYELVATIFTFLRMLLTEDQKGAKLSAVVRGTWDGLSGRMGRPPGMT